MNPALVLHINVQISQLCRQETFQIDKSFSKKISLSLNREDSTLKSALLVCEGRTPLKKPFALLIILSITWWKLLGFYPECFIFSQTLWVTSVQDESQHHWCTNILTCVPELPRLLIPSGDKRGDGVEKAHRESSPGKHCFCVRSV